MPSRRSTEFPRLRLQAVEKPLINRLTLSDNFANEEKYAVPHNRHSGDADRPLGCIPLAPPAVILLLSPGETKLQNSTPPLPYTSIPARRETCSTSILVPVYLTYLTYLPVLSSM